MLEVDIQKSLAHYELDVQFEAESEIIVLFGASGAGKTTVLNCIAGLNHPDQGMIRLDGETFYKGSDRIVPTRKRNTGYLFQDYALFPHMSVEKNIWYGVKKERREAAKTAIRQLVEVLGIPHLLRRYPHEISGGEKQRVALARALATEPSILLLDEPLSALDEKTRAECQDELLRLHSIWKIPFLIVTHDKSEAQKLGDRILVMDRGTIVQEEIIGV